MKKDIQTEVKEFNNCLQNSILPEEWLYGYLRPVVKPKRDPKQIGSYGIITL